MSNSAFTPDNWCAVSGSENLETNQVIQVTVSGQEVAVWRDSEGQAHACSNFCVHRGMRLSHGFIKDNRLVCRYHGWRYGQDGQCDYIPAMPETKPPKALCTKTYKTREAIGLIWLHLGEQDSSADAFLNHQAAANNTVFCRSLYVDRSHEALLEKLKGSIFLPHKLQLELSSDNWINSESDRLPTEGSGQSYKCQWIAGEEKVSVEYTSRLLAPGVFAIDANTFGESLILALQPIGDNKTGIHISVQSESADGALRLHYAKWAKTMRWMLENDQSPNLNNGLWLSH